MAHHQLQKQMLGSSGDSCPSGSHLSRLCDLGVGEGAASPQSPLLALRGITADFFALVALCRGPGRIRPQKEGSGALSSRRGRAGCPGEQVSSGGPAIGVLEGLRLVRGSFPQHSASASAPPHLCPAHADFLCDGGRGAGRV